MKRLAWLTDIHLDFLDAKQVDAFCQNVASCDTDAFMIGGDISIATQIQEHLLLLARHLRGPIYFVLGNHDFYGGSIAGVGAAIYHEPLDWLVLVGGGVMFTGNLINIRAEKKNVG